MAERKRIRKVFNLLQPKSAPPTAWDNIYNWLVTRARLIMIVAEILVVVVFVSKVLVDIQAKNYDDTIKALDEQIQFEYKSVEPRVRTFQQKTASYASLWKQSSSYAEILAEIRSYLVDSQAEVVISVLDNFIEVKGVASNTDVQALEAAMKSSSTFTAVQLAEVTADGVELFSGNRGFEILANITSGSEREI